MSGRSDEAPSGKNAFTSLFVRRPVLALVLNLLMVVAGLAAYFGIEVRELPDVDRPVVSVRTDFEGAAPQTIDQELTRVIEGAVARVSGLKSISSTSSFGQSRVTLEFSENIDLAVAANDVRDALGRVMQQLPEDADAPQIVKADSDAQAIIRLAVTSSSLNMDDLTQLVNNEIIDRLAAVDGVADVQIYGDQEKVFRVDINQASLASRGLTIANVTQALSNAALDVPAGSLESTTQNIVVRATANLQTPADFENLVLQSRVRLGDVATVTLGPRDGTTALRFNGTPAIGLGIVRQAQSNTLNISNGVKAAVEDLSQVLPDNTKITITSDDAVFINGALHEVITALVLASLIVVAVIYLFLRDWRATLIPAVSIPVVLIGTLAAIYLIGFSINILTLLAIVLATGLVVDDAIVVLENIVRLRAQGMGPRAAAVLGTREVFFAVIATTATLAAVFIPLSFLPGQVGGLFREFGFVLAFSVALSSVVALTLCPMLASRMLSHKVAQDGHGPVARVGNKLAGWYQSGLQHCLNAPLVVVAASLVFSAISLFVFTQIKNELTPNEDRAMVMLRVSTPQGSSLDYTRDQLQRVEEYLQPLRQGGELRNIYSISGQGGSANSGSMVLTLAPWEERTRTQEEIVGDINAAVARVPALRGNAIQANSLRIRGAGNGLQMALVGNDNAALTEAAANLVQALEETNRYDTPRLTNEPTQAQISVAINRERASDLGVDINGLANALQALLEGRSVTSVFVGGEAYPVYMSSSTRPIDDPTDLENVFIKTADNKIVPMSVIASMSEGSVAPQLNREQQLASVAITAGLKDGVSLGDAVAEATRLAQPLLPPGSRIIPLAEAATLAENSSSMALTFGFAIAIIFLVLAAQFESVLSSIIIMTTVPLGLACAVFALILTGSSLNIYSQIGLVLLIGVMAKNGILIVEFANQLRDRGYEVRQAIEEACALRLRPVMMTMIAAVLGGVPLVFAQGAGAEARVELGWVIVGGLGFATTVTLFVTPVAYLLIARFSKPHAHAEARLQQEMASAANASRPEGSKAHLHAAE